MAAVALNPSQIRLLNLFARSHQSEESVEKLRRVLFNYLMDLAIAEADRVWDERGYTAETVEQWKHENMRVNVDEIKKRKLLENENRS